MLQVAIKGHVRYAVRKYIGLYVLCRYMAVRAGQVHNCTCSWYSVSD